MHGWASDAGEIFGEADLRTLATSSACTLLIRVL